LERGVLLALSIALLAFLRNLVQYLRSWTAFGITKPHWPTLHL